MYQARVPRPHERCKFKLGKHVWFSKGRNLFHVKDGRADGFSIRTDSDKLFEIHREPDIPDILAVDILFNVATTVDGHVSRKELRNTRAVVHISILDASKLHPPRGSILHPISCKLISLHSNTVRFIRQGVRGDQWVDQAWHVDRAFAVPRVRVSKSLR